MNFSSRSLPDFQPGVIQEATSLQMKTLTRTLARRLILSGAIVGGGSVALAAGSLAGAAIGYWAVKQNSRFRLAGRTVLITGGSRGLGLALARVFLKQGAK